MSNPLTGMLERHVDEQITKFAKAGEALDIQRKPLVKRQRIERKRLVEKQQDRHTKEARHRYARLPRGLKGIWQRITGNYSKIARQNKQEAMKCNQRDRLERQDMIERHLDERRNLQRKIKPLRDRYHRNIEELHKDIKTYLEMSDDELKREIEQRMEDRKYRNPSLAPGLRM